MVSDCSPEQRVGDGRSQELLPLNPFGGENSAVLEIPLSPNYNPCLQCIAGYLKARQSGRPSR
jgi:hypothetical protein